MNLYNNIIPVLHNIQEKTKCAKNKDTFLEAYKNLIKCYMSIKDADLLNNPIFIDKYWDLIEYFDIFSVGTPTKIINSVNNKNAKIREFNLTHHTQYNFMRQEQAMNKKIINTDYFHTMDNDITNIYYNLKRFENDNVDLATRRASSKNKKKIITAEDAKNAKYIIDRSYCKIIEKIDELFK
jgi:hypothetical protein